MSQRHFLNHGHQSYDYPESGNQYHHCHTSNFGVHQNQMFSRDCSGASGYRTHGKNGMFAM